MTTMRKFKPLDENDPNTDCTVLCYYQDGYGRVGCAGATTDGPEYDIDCYDGCQNTE